MSRPSAVPVAYRRRRGLCVDCGEPLVLEGEPALLSGATCRRDGEHPGICCACADVAGGVSVPRLPRQPTYLSDPLFRAMRRR